MQTRRRSALSSIGVSVAIALAAIVLVPRIGQTQAGAELPDLISDPPRPAFLKELVNPAGDTRLVLTFDGYIHNIGQGPLQVVGNPQEPDGMVQQVREDGEWRDVSNPTVRYETDDGHNHFHLIEAVDYVLWNESQGTQTAAGSKIGFCLVDSEQMEPGTDQAYSEELDDFCQEDNPGATSLRMGISTGWRDIYDATTTLQWVDVSEVLPGRYWIGAITDPNNEIVESNEDNNDLIFSALPATVPGWIPWDVSGESDGGPVEIELGAEAFGTVAAPRWTIEDGPANGTLNAPTGAAVAGSVTYTPNAGFTGEDSFVVSVRDRASRFPLVPATATVTVSVTAAGPEDLIEGFTPLVTIDETFFEIELGQAFRAQITTETLDGVDAELHAVGLPSGLFLDDGAIVGAPTAKGIADVTLVATHPDGARTEQPLTMLVEDPSKPGLAVIADRSSPLMQPTRQTIGSAILSASFEAVGLPPGVEIDANAPVLLGQPTEVGSYAVSITQTDVEGETRTESFTWTVRPAVAVNFAL